MPHGGLALQDRAAIRGGRVQPGLEQPCAGTGRGVVDRREERAFAAAREAARELQVAPRGRVDRHQAARRLTERRPEQGQPALLRELEVVDDRPQRAGFGPAEGSEAVEALRAEDRGDPGIGGGGIEARRGQRRRGGAGLGDQAAQLGLLALGDQHLARGEPRQHRPEPGAGAGRDREVAGGDVGPGEGALAAHLGIGGEIIVASGFEQAFLGQRARGHQTDHRAGHHGFRAAFLCRRRILHLLADCDPEALADQGQEIALGGMDRHAAHGDVLAEMLAALGQGDVERRRRGLGVGEEHLVEIAHAIEEQRIGMLRLDLVVLRHHRRHGGGIVHAARPGSVGSLIQARLAVPMPTREASPWGRLSSIWNQTIKVLTRRNPVVSPSCLPRIPSPGRRNPGSRGCCSCPRPRTRRGARAAAR